MAETPETMELELAVHLDGTVKVTVEVGVDPKAVARDLEDSLQAGTFNSVMTEANYRVKPV